MVVPSLVWKHDGLTKHRFVRENLETIKSLIRHINDEATLLFDNKIVDLTLHDVCAVLNAEAGLDRYGNVNPAHIHSLGEHGLLPLPTNIDFWIDGDATWNKPMDLGKNMYFFFSYCSSIKNKAFKTIDGKRLYRELFELAFSRQDLDMQARLLAGVVHGYFEIGTYSSKVVPLDYLIAEYSKLTPVDRMMTKTDYMRGNIELLQNRHVNLEQGLLWAT